MFLPFVLSELQPFLNKGQNQFDAESTLPVLAGSDARPQQFMHGQHFPLLVGAAGPEETAESVAAFARDDVDVKMRDALADDVVHGDEGAFCFHRLLHSAGEHLSVGEKRTDQGGGEIRQSGVVCFRNQQDVAGEKRADVEEGDGDFVFENNLGFEFARNDFAEEAGFVLSCVELGCIQLR